jgi:ribose transport system permease protein
MTASTDATPRIAIPPAIASFVGRKSALLGATVVFVAFYTVYAVIGTGALTPFGVLSFTNSGASIALAAAGEAIVIMAGGFDLSVGAIVALVNVIVATRMHDNASSMVLVSLLAIAVGVGAGAINGIVVTLTRLPSVVVTLATSFVWSGVALLVLSSPGGSVPQPFADALTGSEFGNLPNAVLVLAALVGMWLMVSRTPLRTHILALGGDPQSAQASGLRTARVQISAFALAGLCYALAALFLSALTVSGTPDLGPDFTLDAFAAVVVGGTQFGGGRGSPVSGLIGAYVLYASYGILFASGASTFMNYIFTGAILVLAVIIQNPRNLVLGRHGEPVSGAGG